MLRLWRWQSTRVAVGRVGGRELLVDGDFASVVLATGEFAGIDRSRVLEVGWLDDDRQVDSMLPFLRRGEENGRGGRLTFALA